MYKRKVYILIDCSAAMFGARAAAVNAAMEEVKNSVMPKIIQQSSNELSVEFLVLGFAGQSVFTILPLSSPEQFLQDWQPVPDSAFDGGTPTGAAIEAVVLDIKGGNHGDLDPNALPPAIILISDGEPNGTSPTYEEAMRYADKADKDDENHVYLFRKALRVAIGINVEDSGRESLKKFGSLSQKMIKAGLQPYVDCSDQYLDALANIITSATLNLSMQ